MLSFDDVEQARGRIGQQITPSPLTWSPKLSAMMGSRLYLKCENLQMTGSFKERGALNRLLTLSDEQRARGVIASSAGNHAQGLAYNCQRLGVPATIVMPTGTPLTKESRTRGFGARVILHGNNYDEAYAHALELSQRDDLTFVHPFNDLAIMAGQGTIGLEILEQNPYIEVVVVPIGGGGLISGIAVALKETNPRIKVIGVEAEAVPSMQASVAAGRVVEPPTRRTIADGIAVRRVGELTLAVTRRYVDDIVTVTEEEISNAILLLLESEKTVVEGSGATTLAAIRAGRVPQADGRRTALILSGGNIDVNVISRIIERGLAKDGRIMAVRVVLDDAPGSLARLTAILAEARANVIEIHHNRTFARISKAVVDLTLETRGFDHIADLEQRLSAEGYGVEPRKMTAA
ncbi:MAG: threonine ammonia-lyase [Myxococcales bacterium]|nr:threonine ammonia-lyase [Myxococcales bacterium]